MNYTGFAAPDEPGAHIFRVEIPEKGGRILIIEDYGHGEVLAKVRATVPWQVWEKIGGVAATDFNTRLRALKLPPGEWKVGGATLLDRFLGRELCVLAWGAKKEGQAAIGPWLKMRPAERWARWLEIIAKGGKNAA